MALAALGLGLSACGFLQGQPVTAATQSDINLGATIACGLAEAGDTVFNAKNTDPDKAKVEALVYAGFHEVCKPPYTADLNTIIKKATDAYVAIKALTPAAPAAP